ncbi:ATP-dependent metallopeptidase FtsH/Yme1/Tma family protein [Candidatus Falkowbacteria bacterium]|jgi:cell division protease FtsH|nr:ATP-dependent metallopeptidase FtsH/Yme1/Tma family protein [Candidatus Falkowbacteria bacterium]MBT5503056.1 ATP-dependent metallopeptidase FtsH/Yme1/Tma family protein [Candidatus Falkowbacteria bacterium]MBT6574125.1 ATP-dependent metallopeptidase FtsH/Yme1/Tma family protein [Candidatus Falkowbacteria bacterium]MBT7348728.1 ATP-dependent metallopeptidase FtsH/Yme1/Tma family protein [Candidatus Falkowbacteria bacterium]MBT7500518.1 ATP-dependent metallopeptidase FtsH/Yme1/Tma family prot
MNKYGIIKNLVLFLIVFLFIASIFSLYNVSEKEVGKIDIQKMVQEINEEKVQKIDVQGDMLKITLLDGTNQELKKETSESLSELLNNFSISEDKMKKFAIEVKDESGFKYWMGAILPFLIPLLFIGVFLWYMLRQVQGANSRAMSFGQSRAREVKQSGKDKVTFKNVAGVKEAKEELQEIVEFLKFPKKFTTLGAKIPKGVLLMGSPGTGKTLLAKAVAGEADVPFFSISGSEFVEMFVGVGASRVRDLFKKAKKNSPCIVFIDEIDAVGRQRGAGLGGSHDEREQTLNQILVEMDGFDPHANVIVMAATNRPDVLDPALLRPGRFDRRVILELPDINDREEILKVHSKQKPLSKDIDMRRVAERTPGFSGADLANLFNEAAILAARRDKKKIDQKELLESIEKVMLGPERKSHILSAAEKKVTAVHEAGHALVSHILPNSDPVHKVSIISRGRAAGYTMNLPEKDKYLHSKSEYIDNLAVLLAGHKAEKLEFGEVTTGASNDLQRATDLARSLITQYGMSDDLAPRTYGDKDEMIFLGREISEKRNYSEKVAEQIDSEIDKLVLQAAQTAEKVISENKDKMEKIVNELLEKEKIEKDEFLFLVDGIKLPAPKDSKDKKDKEDKEATSSDESEEKKEIKKDKEKA